MDDVLDREETFEFQPDNAPEASEAPQQEATGESKVTIDRREWSEEAKETLRKIMTERWQDPEYRQKVAEGRARAKQQKAAQNTTEVNENEGV